MGDGVDPQPRRLAPADAAVEQVDLGGDFREHRIERLVDELEARHLGVEIVAPNEIYDVECDIFAPCALGAIINDDTLPRLKAKAVAGGANPATQNLTIANGGTGTLSFTASDDAAWLSVAPASGSAPATVTATVNTAGLAAGTYTANVTVAASGATGSPQTIPVTLTVSPAATELLGGANVIGTNGSSAPVGAAEVYRLTASTTGTTKHMRAARRSAQNNRQSLRASANVRDSLLIEFMANSFAGVGVPELRV